MIASLAMYDWPELQGAQDRTRLRACAGVAASGTSGKAPI